jgi:hypothetical protein
MGYNYAGRFHEALATTEEGLRLAQGDVSLGAEHIGFSPSLGLSCARGMLLILMGRPHEGAAEVDRVIELARTSQQHLPTLMARIFHVMRCWVTGEAAPALAHGRQAVDYAERTGNELGRIFAYIILGLACVVNDAWRDALESLETAMTIGRERRLSVLDGWALGVMAAAHLGRGDRARALELAEEGVAVGRRLGARQWELYGLLTRMRALRETHGVAATREIEIALGEADAWLEMSGATSYAPFVHVERAELARLEGDDARRRRELREAQRLFLEIGAPIRAAEVAKQLAS